MAMELAALMGAVGRRDDDFASALDIDVARLAATDTPRTIILPTCSGVRRQPNLTALLALLLARFGVPTLLHGDADGGEWADDDAKPDARATRSGPVSTAKVLSELGVEAASTVAEAQASLARNRIAYVSVGVLAPGLAALMSRNSTCAVRSYARVLAQLIDPFAGASYRVVGVTDVHRLAQMREWLASTGADALLLRGCEGEPFADPRRQPRLEDFNHGVSSTVPCADDSDVTALPDLPASVDARVTATWIARVLAGEVPVPAPILRQLACCLNGARRPLQTC